MCARWCTREVLGGQREATTLLGRRELQHKSKRGSVEAGVVYKVAKGDKSKDGGRWERDQEKEGVGASSSCMGREGLRGGAY